MNIILFIKFIYYVKDPNESKYQYLINKRKNNGRKQLKDLKSTKILKCSPWQKM